MVRGSENFLQQITVLAKDGYATVDASGARVINAEDPINPQDLATKAYVDGYDYIIKATAADTSPDYLFNKLANGYGITITTLDIGGGDIHTRFGQFSEVRNHALSAGANNNVSPTGWQSVAIARWSAPGAASVTGINPTLQSDDVIVKRLYNVGSFNITLNHENIGSAPDYRLLLPNGGDIVLLPNTGITIYYDQIVNRWRADALATSGGGDVFGPASSTDLALARFDGITGKLIQNSVAVLDDFGGLNLGPDGYISIGDSTSDTGDVRLDLGGYITGIVNGGVEIYGADGDAGGAVSVYGGQSNANDTSAPAISLTGGMATGTVSGMFSSARGGGINIQAGESTNDMGGIVLISGGTSGDSTSIFDQWNGGCIRILGGTATLGRGGDINIISGYTSDITVTTGNVNISSNLTNLVGGQAGYVSIVGGNADNGTAGGVGLTSGTGRTGGAIGISCGSSTVGNGPNLSLTAGYSSGPGADGGDVNIWAGKSYDNGDGGSINILAGEGEDTGYGGDVIIQSGDPVGGDPTHHGNIEIRAHEGSITAYGYAGINLYGWNGGYVNLESANARLTTSDSTINIAFTPSKTPDQMVFSDGYLAILDERQIRWYGHDNHYSGFKASTTGSTQIWTLPEEDGPDGYVITTDGAGTLYWSAGGGGGGGSQTLSQTLALGNITNAHDIVISLGDVIIGGGTIIASTPGNIVTPGAMALGIAAGSGFDDGSLTLDGDGGLIQITAGEGYGIGDGGSVDISAGSANGVDANGGDVYLTSGLGIGTGRGGHIQFFAMPSDGTGDGGEFQVYMGPDPEDLSFKVDANGDGYFYNNLEIVGKLTVGGLIDPTGLVLSEQFSVPGGVPSTGNYTLWVRDDGYALLTNSSGDTTILSGGASILQNLSDVLSIGNSANSQTISDLLDPVEAQDAATKNYVDGYVESLGGDLSGSLPNPEVTDLTIASEEQGSILYFDGSNWVQLPPGEDGYALITHDTGANPTWGMVASSAPVDSVFGRIGDVVAAIDDYSASQIDNDSTVSGEQVSDALEYLDGYIGDVYSLSVGGDLSGNLPNPEVTDLSITGEEQGSVLYFDGSNWVQLPPGTDGYALITHDTGANPTWGEVAGSSPVDSVFGRVGDIVAATDDYSASQIDNDSSVVGEQVSDALEYLDGYVGDVYTLPVGGDLSGSLPNPQVTDLSITGEEQGSVLYFDGTNWVQLPPGDDGYVLTTHGTSADPTWEESSGTGGITPPTIGENGYVPIANNGDLSYLSGGTDGYVLTWNSGTTSWVSAISNDTFAIHDNVPGEISAIPEKATPAATDLLIIEDSADSNNKKRIQISSIFDIPGLNGMINDAFVATENQTDFTLSQSPSNDVAIMVVDGITQSSLDYTVSGTSVTYSGLALSAGQAIDFWYSLGTGGGGGGSGIQFISILSGIETHDLDGWKTVGIVEITSTEFAGTASLEAVLYTSDGYADGYARLYNTTTMAQVGSDLTTTNNLPTLLSTAITLTTGSNLYELQIRVEQDGTDEFVSCGMGRIKITGSGGGGTTETWLSPEALDSDVNDWGPTGFSTATVVRVDAVDDGYSITGFDASATVVKKEIINISAYDLVIANQDVGSVATNRIISQTGGLVLAADDSMTIIYDPVTERWRVI